jgi:predicted adenylyl cyclase CyaB
MEEIEIKYRLSGPEEHGRLHDALRALGATLRPTRYERNTLFDTRNEDLKKRRCAFRLRVVDGTPGGRLTLKGPTVWHGRVKSRQETEVDVLDAAATLALLHALGYRETISYDTQRQPWRLGDVEVVLDTLVFGHFCELEGPHEAILRLSQQLGLDPSQAEQATYPRLMARYLARKPPASRAARTVPATPGPAKRHTA